MTNGVDTLHPQYETMLPVWQRCIDAADGEVAVHKAGVRYLPKLAEETPEEYDARKGRTPFFNATWRTIQGMKGMLFRKDTQLVAPTTVMEYLTDADMAGTPIDQLAQELTEEVLTTGRAGLMVDYPSVNTDETMTVARAAAMGLRPMLAKYDGKSIINWKTARIGNRLLLTLIVLLEDSPVGDSEFGHETETRYRVLDLVPTPSGMVYRQRVFRINDKNTEELISEVFPMIGSRPLSEIPFIIFGADSIGPRIETPPLLDLVMMNFHHYTVSADYEHGCHFSGLPTAVISGYHAGEGETLRIGGTAIITLPDPNATAKYMEVENDFKALSMNLESKKSEMAVLGARMLENQKAQVEAADTIRQRSAGESSALAALAATLSAGITRALNIFAAWAGAAGDVRFDINRDFMPQGMTAQELTALVQAWQSGAISQQVLFENLQAGEIISADDTFEEEQERLASQGPVLE